MRFSLYGIFILFLIGATNYSGRNLKRQSFVPPNDLHRADKISGFDANMDEDEFNRILDDAEKKYQPIFAHHNAKLVIERFWEDSTVNAYAYQQDDEWRLGMLGGLARRPEITSDGFALVVCHEIGHHLAGYPFYDDAEWPSIEGQSDYFASQVCGKKLWGRDYAKNKSFRKKASLDIKSRCDASWKWPSRQNLCYRTLVAGQSLANLFGSLGRTGVPTYQTPDPTIVDVTQPSHPDAQCRLDTLLNGALCDAKFDERSIPGRNMEGGQGLPAAEKMAQQSSCMRADGYGYAKRPRCWFAPTVRLSAEKDNAVFTELAGNGNGVPEPGETYSLLAPIQSNFEGPVGGANGLLSTLTSAINVGVGETIYSQILPNELVQPEGPLVVKIEQSFACGKRLPLTLDLRTNFGLDRNILSYRTGVPEPFETVEIYEAVKIPPAEEDGEFILGSQTLSALSGKIDRGAFDLELSVESTGLDTEEVVLLLLSPNNEVYELNIFGDKGDLNQSYKVPAEDEKGRGEWNLIVLNFSMDEGAELTWRMKLIGGKCEPVLEDPQRL